MKRVLGEKAERVLHHRAFMTVPPYSPQGQVASYCLGQDRPAAGRQAVFVFSVESNHSANKSDSLSEMHPCQERERVCICLQLCAFAP